MSVRFNMSVTLIDASFSCTFTPDVHSVIFLSYESELISHIVIRTFHSSVPSVRLCVMCKNKIVSLQCDIFQGRSVFPWKTSQWPSGVRVWCILPSMRVVKWSSVSLCFARDVKCIRKQSDLESIKPSHPHVSCRRHCSRRAQWLAVTALHNNYHWRSDSKPFNYATSAPSNLLGLFLL